MHQGLQVQGKQVVAVNEQLHNAEKYEENDFIFTNNKGTLWAQRGLLIWASSWEISKGFHRRFHSNHQRRKELTLGTWCSSSMSPLAHWQWLVESLKLREQLPWPVVRSWVWCGGCFLLMPRTSALCGWCTVKWACCQLVCELEVDKRAEVRWELASPLPSSCRLNFLKLPKGLTVGPAASKLTFSVQRKVFSASHLGP